MHCRTLGHADTRPQLVSERRNHQVPTLHVRCCRRHFAAQGRSFSRTPLRVLTPLLPRALYEGPGRRLPEPWPPPPPCCHSTGLSVPPVVKRVSHFISCRCGGAFGNKHWPRVTSGLQLLPATPLHPSPAPPSPSFPCPTSPYAERKVCAGPHCTDLALSDNSRGSQLSCVCHKPHRSALKLIRERLTCSGSPSAGLQP